MKRHAVNQPFKIKTTNLIKLCSFAVVLFLGAAGDMGGDQRSTGFIAGQHVDIFNFTRD
jgi:hypothetical protein